MSYTTEEAVKGIIEVDSTAPIAMCISDAAGMMDEIIGTVVLVAKTAMAERVNRWLAAHLLAAGPRLQLASESVKGITEVYQYKLGKSLASTMYGQQAMLMDSTGRLSAWSKAMEDGSKRKVELAWLGTTPSTVEES